jgi:hypothetical protein
MSWLQYPDSFIGGVVQCRASCRSVSLTGRERVCQVVAARSVIALLGRHGSVAIWCGQVLRHLLVRCHVPCESVVRLGFASAKSGRPNSCNVHSSPSDTNLDGVS